jgi:hypothetical protein
MLCSDKRIRGKSMHINDISRQQFSKIASPGFAGRIGEQVRDCAIIGSAAEDQIGLRLADTEGSTAGKFSEVYASGKRVAPNHIWQDHISAGEALPQFGTYDFQRDKATNSFFDEYVPAANYAVGAYMAGASYGLYQSLALAQAYADFNSSNAFDDKYKGRQWKIKGWENAHRGDWR